MSSPAELEWSRKGAAFARMVRAGRSLETIAKDAGCTETFVRQAINFARDNPPDGDRIMVIPKTGHTTTLETSDRPLWSIPDKITLRLARDAGAELRRNLR